MKEKRLKRLEALKMENPIKVKSFAFAVRIVKFVKWLDEQGVNYKLSDQILRSGTSIGANVVEAQSGHTKKDFAHKMGIAFKEANETRYWIELLQACKIIDEAKAKSLLSDLTEIIKLLASILKSSKGV